MHEFLFTTFGYPTIIFTILLVVAFLYWSMVIIGAIGIDVLDLDVDGATESVASAGDVASEVDGEALSLGLFAGTLSRLRLRDVPFTLVLSAVTLFSWIIAQLCSSLVLVHWGEQARLVGGTVVLFFGPVVSLLLTSVVLRPLAGMLKPEPQTHRDDWIGKLVHIDTSYVDHRFGTARADDGGAGLILQVRCDGENALRRGDRALVVAFDPRKNAYEVAPVDDMLSSESRTSS